MRNTQLRMKRKKSKDLFERSIPPKGEYRYDKLLKKSPEYRRLVGFEHNKRIPIYRWFHYKEGFAPYIAWNLLKEFRVKEKSMVLDPFCGTGNTLLACKQAGYNCLGVDISPLSVFVSNTKLQDDYDLPLLKEKIDEIASMKFKETSLRWPQIGFIDVRKAFPKFARNDLLYFKEKIMDEGDEKIRNFLMLGLLSTVIPVSNVIRDGGVLKIRRRRNVPPVGKLLRNRLKMMYNDLEGNGKKGEVESKATVGDARHLTIDEGSVDVCITSPPYLNWVDYSKIYALELALLVGSGREIRKLRSESVRSHIGARERRKKIIVSEKLDEVMWRLEENPVKGKPPVTVRGYFEDMYMCMDSIYGSLREGGIAAVVIGNACMPDLTIDSDLILAELSEEVGFKATEIKVAKTRWCDVHGIRKERPVRESIVILGK